MTADVSKVNKAIIEIANKTNETIDLPSIKPMESRWQILLSKLAKMRWQISIAQIKTLTSLNTSGYNLNVPWTKKRLYSPVTDCAFQRSLTNSQTLLIRSREREVQTNQPFSFPHCQIKQKISDKLFLTGLRSMNQMYTHLNTTDSLSLAKQVELLKSLVQDDAYDSDFKSWTLHLVTQLQKLFKRRNKTVISSPAKFQRIDKAV